MYIFGHAGTMDPEKRELIGYNLFHLIKNIHNEYLEKDEIKPIITIIGHSHGGNIGLNIATGLRDNPLSFTIDRLILLASPVQKFTKDLVSSPLFKKVYSLHSHRDLVQIADLQGLYTYNKDKYDDNRIYSERHFKPQEKLIQAHIKWKKTPPPLKLKHKAAKQYFTLISTAANITGGQRGLTHIEFMLPPFISHLPKLIDDLDKQALVAKVDDNDPDILVKI